MTEYQKQVHDNKRKVIKDILSYIDAESGYEGYCGIDKDSLLEAENKLFELLGLSTPEYKEGGLYRVNEGNLEEISQCGKTIGGYCEDELISLIKKIHGSPQSKICRIFIWPEISPTLKNKELSDTENNFDFSIYDKLVKKGECKTGNGGVVYPEKPIGSIQHISEIKEMVIPAPKNENI